jgi:hypothetical protein
MSTPEPSDKPPTDPPPEPIKLEPQPVPIRSAAARDTSVSVATMVAMGLCSLTPFLLSMAIRNPTYFWVWLLPLLIGFGAVGGVAVAKGENRRYAILVTIVIATLLALFVHVFVVCSNTMISY